MLDFKFLILQLCAINVHVECAICTVKSWKLNFESWVRKNELWSMNCEFLTFHVAGIVTGVWSGFWLWLWKFKPSPTFKKKTLARKLLQFECIGLLEKQLGLRILIIMLNVLPCLCSRVFDSWGAFWAPGSPRVAPRCISEHVFHDFGCMHTCMQAEFDSIEMRVCWFCRL